MTFENKIEGGIWAIGSIQDTPEVWLDDWKCFELQMTNREGRSRHLAGCAGRGRDRHGQVSSAVQAIDPGTRKLTTRSGRIYELGTSTGLIGDGDYTWHEWIRVHRASAIVDVTDEIKRLLAGLHEG